MSDEAILAAGTLVEFSTNLETPVYKELMGAMSLGSVGYMAEAKEKTTLRDTEKKYGAGIKDAPDKSIKGQHYALNTDQQEFLDAAEATQTVLVRITYPTPEGATTGAIAEMELALLGFELDDVTGEDWMMFTVNAKQNSFTFTKATTT